jgi:hypothetical protein
VRDRTNRAAVYAQCSVSAVPPEPWHVHPGGATHPLSRSLRVVKARTCHAPVPLPFAAAAPPDGLSGVVG